SFFVLGAASLAAESGQWVSAAAAGWTFVAMVLYSALVVSVLAHTLYYGLILRYGANLIAPLTLMSPLMAIALGVMLTGDRFDLRMGIGSAVTLSGVLIIAVRRNLSWPRAILLRKTV